jgi:hypothetical protein
MNEHVSNGSTKHGERIFMYRSDQFCLCGQKKAQFLHIKLEVCEEQTNYRCDFHHHIRYD